MTVRVVHADCRDAMRDMSADSVDAIVTDPPYGLSREPDAAEVLRHWLAGDDYVHRGNGFMGKSWDSFVPGPAVWREAIRVLKPGGFCLAFFGTRTYDLGVIAMRLAGFEIRDMQAWLHGQGFPKSLDVSKAFDRAGGQSTSWFGPWLKEWRTKRGLSQRELCERCGFHGDVNRGGTIANWELGLGAPTPERFTRIVDVLGLPFESIEAAEREVVGQRTSGLGTGNGAVPLIGDRGRDITAPATDLARQWAGWGTALKPALEPIVLARKPLSEPTVAANVARWGTGALNVDECRVAGVKPDTTRGAGGQHGRFSGIGAQGRILDDGRGRHPPNVLHDGSQGVLELFPETVSNSTGKGKVRGIGFGSGAEGSFLAPRPTDRGSAARFYPSFPPDDAPPARYCPKAPKADRVSRCTGCGWRTMGRTPDVCPSCNASGAGTWGSHPTVKPPPLMRWLCRLVTPPGGTVLDPFAGSGTTLQAAREEGFATVGIEREAEFVADCRHRLGMTALAAAE